VFFNSLLVLKKVKLYYNDDGEIARKSVNPLRQRLRGE
jgi:hypothetical protein